MKYNVHINYRMFTPILVFVLLSFVHSFGLWPNINRFPLLSCIEHVYENNQYLPSQSILFNPKVDMHNVTEEDKMQFEWYMIGRNTDFPFRVPRKITIWGKEYTIWKQNKNDYVCLTDTCSEDLNSLYENPHFHVVEKNNQVFLNTYQNASNKATMFSRSDYSTHDSFRHMFVETCIDLDPSILVDTSLDIVHVIFAKLFTKNKVFEPSDISIMYSPHSLHNSVNYTYTCGPQSMTSVFFGTNEMTISSEIIHPYATISCISIGDKRIAFETHILPIDATRCRIFVFCYRNVGLSYSGDKVINNVMQTFLDVYTQLSVCRR